MPELHNVKRVAFEIAFYLSVVIFLAAVVFPFYWMIKTSLETGTGLFSYPPRLIPQEVTFSGYKAAVSETALGLWLFNSFVVAGGSTVMALVVGISGAYGLSRFRYRGKSAIALVILTTQMMPPLVLIIPIYTIFIKLNLTDTLFGLVLGNFAFALPVVIWMMKSVFDSIPFEIEEAARIDGASWLYILLRITLPLALPGVVATGIFTFLSGWDEFLLARSVVTQADKWVGTVGLSSFIGVYVTPWDQILAAATIFTLPPLILFLFVQKYFIAGLSAGAVKA
jgi:multiple sugar transport system permease protein